MIWLTWRQHRIEMLVLGLLLALITYQPADRFWLFQGMESAIFFGLAAALLALAFWWVRIN